MIANLIIWVFLLIMLNLTDKFTIPVENKSLKHVNAFHPYLHLQTLCSDSYYEVFHCWQGKPKINAGEYVTYKDKIMSILNCPYFQANENNFTGRWQTLLSGSLSEVNDYMYGPLNRKGLVCSECGDGFGPSATSFGYRYPMSAWYRCH